MANINVGVIGYGYWGPNIVRNFFSAADCTVKAVADGRPERLAVLAKVFPTICGVKTAEDIINDKEIDAVVVATPVFSHFPLAKKALENGKHVLIEKPMTSTVEFSPEASPTMSHKSPTRTGGPCDSMTSPAALLIVPSSLMGSIDWSLV